MAKQIPLTRGKVALVDDQDYEHLNQWKWYADMAGRDSWRAVRISSRKWVAMHRVIMNAPKGMDVDHINGDGLDNRRENLRVCTHAENMFNLKTRVDSSTKVKGVFVAKRKSGFRYRSHIQVHGKMIDLGTFSTIDEAKAAYDAASKKYHGAFSRVSSGKGQHENDR